MLVGQWLADTCFGIAHSTYRQQACSDALIVRPESKIMTPVGLLSLPHRPYREGTCKEARLRDAIYACLSHRGPDAPDQQL